MHSSYMYINLYIKAPKPACMFTKHNRFLKMTTLQFLVYGAFLLSLLLLPYSLDLSHLFSSSNFRFSASLLPLLTQTLERKYMFLVCNGLVVFLTKNLSFSGSRNANDNEAGVTAAGEMEAPNMGGPVEINVVSIEKQEIECMETEQVQGRAAQAMIMEETEDEDVIPEVEENGSWSLIPMSSSVGDEGENDEVNLSTEELNRKFDEFIRKMKEEMRIDAQRQLLVSV